jgi:hypothetical protein
VKTILLIDGDLGFAFWLGHALDQTGYETLPARSVPDAIKLLEEFNIAVDLVLINTSLPEAESFIAGLRRAQTPFKVIAISDTPQPFPPFPWADAIHHKSEAVDEATRSEWIQVVKSVLMVNVEPN